MSVQQLLIGAALLTFVLAAVAPAGGRVDPFRLRLVAAGAALLTVAWAIGPGPGFAPR